jgi:CRP/FNR family cyclic AMP-dependent transcriptional regulator
MRMLVSKPSDPNLGGFALLGDVAPDELETLAEHTTAGRYYSGELIFQSDDPADRIYLVQDGLVKVSLLSRAGTELVLDIVWPGSLCGELLVTRDGRQLGVAEALCATTVYIFPRQCFVELMQRQPTLCSKALSHLADQQRWLLSRLRVLMEPEAGLRLLMTLLQLAERRGAANGGYLLPHEVTQGHLAAMTGLHRSTVSELINNYRRRGVLGGHGRALVVHAAMTRRFLAAAGVEEDC